MAVPSMKLGLVRRSSASSMQQMMTQSVSQVSKYADGDNDELFDNLAQEMGEDFGFGFDSGQNDPNTKRPCRLPVPQQNMEQRSSDSLSVTWPAIGQRLTDLQLEAVAYNPTKENPFDDGTQRLVVEVPSPTTATGATIAGLRPSTAYVLRLYAANDAGSGFGPTSSPLETLEYTPIRGDKSGFIVITEVSNVAKVPGRKLSFSKYAPNRHWFVLEGGRLAWFDKVDGKEIGMLPLKSVETVAFEETAEIHPRIVIGLKDRTQMCFVPSAAHLDRAANCREWVACLRNARESTIASPSTSPPKSLARSPPNTK